MVTTTYKQAHLECLACLFAKEFRGLSLQKNVINIAALPSMFPTRCKSTRRLFERLQGGGEQNHLSSSACCRSLQLCSSRNLHKDAGYILDPRLLLLMICLLHNSGFSSSSKLFAIKHIISQIIFDTLMINISACFEIPGC